MNEDGMDGNQLGERPVRPVASSGPANLPPVQHPPQAGYRSPADYRRSVPPPPKGVDSGLVMTVLGAVAALSAVMVFISTFLPWVSIGGVSTTGINLMSSNTEGFFMVRWGWGGIIFTGFFSLLLGSLMVIAVIMLFLNKRGGATWSVITGVFGFFLALVNIIMVYTSYDPGGVSGATPGAGQWLMLGFSIIILICGAVGLRFAE
ncbi:MAG: hypothetical protein JW738_08660 [Actinobacteria bacterium]|nr:hypothetical protein [Actinomycetota bacterium]